MNRRDLLRNLGLGAAGLAAASAVVPGEKLERTKPCAKCGCSVRWRDANVYSSVTRELWFCTACERTGAWFPNDVSVEWEYDLGGSRAHGIHNGRQWYARWYRQLRPGEDVRLLHEGPEVMLDPHDPLSVGLQTWSIASVCT